MASFSVVVDHQTGVLRTTLGTFTRHVQVCNRKFWRKIGYACLMSKNENTIERMFVHSYAHWWVKTNHKYRKYEMLRELMTSWLHPRMLQLYTNDEELVTT